LPDVEFKRGMMKFAYGGKAGIQVSNLRSHPDMSKIKNRIKRYF